MPTMPNEQSNKSALIAVDDALSAIITLLPKTDITVLPLSDALGYTLAKDLFANLTLPPQAVSAMDGYAVLRDDVAVLPCKLTRIAESAAGRPWGGKITNGQAVRIFTSAAVPVGADTIVIQEDVDPVPEQDGVEIVVRSAGSRGCYIRAIGLDFTAGQKILSVGALLSARAIGLATAAGLTEVTVSLRPKIGILSTGDELIAPGQAPGPGQIISSNASFLKTFVVACGADAVDLGIAPDVPGAMLAAVRSTKETLDLIITTGGASVGTHDHIVSDLDTGAKSGLNFWKIAMRPGKPLISGYVDNIPLIGLPGNPVSTAVCALVFLRPAIVYMTRGTASIPSFLVAVGTNLRANDQRQDYIRANLHNSPNGQIVLPAPRQDSSMMSVLATANTLIIRPPYDPEKQAGDMVTVLHIPAFL